MICGIIEEGDRRVAARTATIDRLKAANQVDENKKRRLKEFLLMWLRSENQKKHQTAFFQVWRQASPPAAVCKLDDASMLPEDFQRLKVEPHNGAALEWWRKTGEVPEGFEIREGEHLRIK